MGKFTRSRAENDEPLSAGRVEYLEQARQRARNKRIRRTAVLLVLLTGIVLFATGLVGSSVAMAKDFIDTARIALLPGAGWPQQTGVSEVTQVESLTGSFVELGKEGCVVYSRSGKKLNSIQSGYARPALAAGKNRFVLYNRSGNELRVESRTQNLYTKQLENSIFLCAMADNGNLAVVTEDVSAMAELLIYNSNMEQVLSWSMSSNDGTPLRMAFSPDGRKLAAAAVTAGGGQMMTNLYLVNLASGDPVSLANQSGVPQWLGWTSSSTILAVYDSRAVLYNAGGGERAAYEFAGNTLKDISVDAAGNVALLLGSGQLHQAVLLDKSLNVQFSGTVSSANSIVRAGSLFYLLSDSGVECYNISGEQQWSQTLAAKPQALLADTKELLLFSGNTAQVLEVPQK
ncbi:DUF5711 family protein [Faecalibacterium hattorii]|uniref:Protein TolB n=1 Tax=Faecalibacterium hattorii TaxID=2935520 RepID=A0A329UNF9_9FIRM|nr:DUF5711 family protein [Faecalibacterium hattorii]RAW62420.1 protein TolB [Faecalibacterium hattorii]